MPELLAITCSIKLRPDTINLHRQWSRITPTLSNHNLMGGFRSGFNGLSALTIAQVTKLSGIATGPSNGS